MNDDKRYRSLKSKVIEHSSNKEFRHSQWFVKYHLEIVERIAHELCERYVAADRAFVDVLIWLHDFEKIIDFENQYNTELSATRAIMQEAGYGQDFIEDMVGSINRFNAKEDLGSATIEIQIVSSADAASHLVGPFTALYWYENPLEKIDDLQSQNAKKMAVDWNQKVTLPEIKEAFSKRHLYQMEITGELPVSFLN